MKINFNIFRGCLFLLIASALKLITPSQIKLMDSSAVNARTFPELVINLMLICGCLTLITGLREGNTNGLTISAAVLKSWLFPLAVLGMILVYMVMIPKAGFILASAIISFALLAVLKCRNMKYYIICLAILILVYFIFTRYLNVFLPSLLS